MNPEGRAIFHIDLDAFFASCEERENPQFAGKPIVVGADPKGGAGRGVVSTANYEARKFGIHSAMPVSRAWRLCPAAIFLPVNGALYARVSKSIMKILRDEAKKYDGIFEQAGSDEAYIDLSEEYNNSHDRVSCCTKIANGIKARIHKQEKVTASVGVGPNMLVAKIASDFQKPDGLTIVNEKNVQKFLDPLPIRKLPGIGPKTEADLKKLKPYVGGETPHIVGKIAGLRKIPQSVLYDALGRHGVSLYEAARGIDHREVGEETETKSISKEHTFEHDTDSAQEILPVFFSLIKTVLETTESDGYKNFKTLTVRIRYADFKTHTRSRSANYSTKDSDKIEKLALRLLWPFLGGEPCNKVRGSVSSGQIKNLEKKRKIRLIGFRVSGF